MKTIYNLQQESKKITKSLLTAFIFLISIGLNANDVKKSIAVINIDTREMTANMKLMTSLVTLELERIDKFEVIDKYDVKNHMKTNKIDLNQAYGKTDLIRIGKLLKVDKILSGSVEKFGDKIVVVLRLIDIKKEKIEKADVMEYIDQEEDIQEMIRISLHNIFGIENDKNVVEMLSNTMHPLSNTKNIVNLSGPRFGASLTMGDAAKRLGAPKNEGGFNMYPFTSTFGYQFEKQYISSGDFQALFEVIGVLNGLESGYFLPSVSVINGFRFNKLGLEFGIGPVFRLTKQAEGYYDSNGDWNLSSVDDPTGIDYIYQIDNRGDVTFSTGLIIAAGFTFKSGYLNFPVNFYVSPRKEGTVIGVLFGFNAANKKRK